MGFPRATGVCVGASVGSKEGRIVGDSVGDAEGSTEGENEGSMDGDSVGPRVDSIDGLLVGLVEGRMVILAVGVGLEGFAVGMNVLFTLGPLTVDTLGLLEVDLIVGFKLGFGVVAVRWIDVELSVTVALIFSIPRTNTMKRECKNKRFILRRWLH